MITAMNLFTADELMEIGEGYNYNIGAYDDGTPFQGAKLFPYQKTDNLKIAYEQLASNRSKNVMAQVHSLDAETRIGDRPTYEQFKQEYEKYKIAEKLNLNSSVKMALDTLGENAPREIIRNYVFNDLENLVAKNTVRWEVMTQELLSEGQITVNENDLTLPPVNFGLATDHRISFANWSDPDHNIVEDIQDLQEASGNKIVRALTTKQVLNYILKNKSVQQAYMFFANQTAFDTTKDTSFLARMLTRESLNFLSARIFGGIVWEAPNDYTYQDSYDPKKAKVHRYRKQNTITFLTTDSAVGIGFLARTDEEVAYSETTGTRVSERALVTVTDWVTQDTPIRWTKACSLFLPVPKDINSIYIATIGA